MTLFEFDVDEKSRAGSDFVARVSNEIRRAAVAEKSARKLTQQAIAEKIGTSRAVVNREISGLENLTARRIGELLWALGWEPLFEARKLTQDEGKNEFESRVDVSSGSNNPFGAANDDGFTIDINIGTASGQ